MALGLPGERSHCFITVINAEIGSTEELAHSSLDRTCAIEATEMIK